MSIHEMRRYFWVADTKTNHVTWVDFHDVMIGGSEHRPPICDVVTHHFDWCDVELALLVLLRSHYYTGMRAINLTWFTVNLLLFQKQIVLTP